MSFYPLTRYRVACEGFSDFERSALASFFRLSSRRLPTYVQVDDVRDCDFLIVDAEHPRAAQAVRAAGRLADAVFVGRSAPAGAHARLGRPIDPIHIMRELDLLVEMRLAAPLVSDEAVLPPRAGGWPSAGVDVLLADLIAPAATSSAMASPSRAAGSWGAPVPMPVAARRSGPRPRRSSRSGLPPRGGAGRDVLVVDADAAARAALVARLESLHYRVHEAPSGDAAIEMVDAGLVPAFALAWLDVDLGAPGSVDGFTVCQHIRQRHAAATGVIFLTGRAGSSDRVRGALAGCDAYLVKPLADADLLRTLQTADVDFEWSAPAAV